MDDLQDIRERWENVTPDWRLRQAHGDFPRSVVGPSGHGPTLIDAVDASGADMTAIANAPSDIKRLLAKLQEAEEVVAGVRDDRDEWRDTKLRSDDTISTLEDERDEALNALEGAKGDVCVLGRCASRVRFREPFKSIAQELRESQATVERLLAELEKVEEDVCVAEMCGERSDG